MVTYVLTLIVLLMVWLQPTSLLAAEKPALHTQSIELQALTRELLLQNQELIAMRRQVEAAKQEIPAAGALDDPMVGFGLLNLPVDSFRFDQEPMTQKQITLAQRFPWFGKRDLRTQRAALNASRLESVLNARRLVFIRDLVEAYYDLGFVAESQKVNTRMTALLDHIVRSVEARYASGNGLQQDVLQAHVEQSRLMEQSHSLRQQRRVLEDRINGLLNRSTFTPIVPPELSGLVELDLTPHQLQQIALQSNAEVTLRRIEIDQAGVDVALSQKAYYPDPNLRLAYGQRDADDNGNDREDFFSASIEFSLPVWSKRKQTNQYEAVVNRREAFRSQHANLAAQLPHQIDAVLTDLDQLKTNYLLYADAILIQAGQWAESARYAYEVGKVNFNTMVSAQLKELELERQAKNHLYQYYRKLAALDYLLGGYLYDAVSGTASFIKNEK